MGQRRMAFLREWADEHECTLYEALEQTIDDEIFKRTKAKQLLALVERFRGQFEGRAVSDVMAAVLNESGYDCMLRTEGSQERLDNVAELKQSIYEFETTCGEEVTLEHYLSHVALLTNAAALGYSIYKSVKNKKNPYTGEVFTEFKYYKDALARADVK